MGNCFGTASPKSKTPSAPFCVTVAFPSILPFSLSISPTSKIASIRAACEAEMHRRQAAGEQHVTIEGKLMTLDADTGAPVHVPDGTSARDASLEPKQYLWFMDRSENTREADLILRSSRLVENSASNSRGVKRGMALIRQDEQATQ